MKVTSFSFDIVSFIICVYCVGALLGAFPATITTAFIMILLTQVEFKFTFGG